MCFVTRVRGTPRGRLFKCLEGWKAKLVEAGYDTIVFEDPLDMLLQQVQAILISPTGGCAGGAVAAPLC